MQQLIFYPYYKILRVTFDHEFHARPFLLLSVSILN